MRDAKLKSVLIRESGGCKYPHWLVYFCRQLLATSERYCLGGVCRENRRVYHSGNIIYSVVFLYLQLGSVPALQPGADPSVERLSGQHGGLQVDQAGLPAGAGHLLRRGHHPDGPGQLHRGAVQVSHWETEVDLWPW